MYMYVHAAFVAQQMPAHALELNAPNYMYAPQTIAPVCKF
jgi:hypothetical protein